MAKDKVPAPFVLKNCPDEPSLDGKVYVTPFRVTVLPVATVRLFFAEPRIYTPASIKTSTLML